MAIDIFVSLNNDKSIQRLLKYQNLDSSTLLGMIVNKVKLNKSDLMNKDSRSALDLRGYLFPLTFVNDIKKKLLEEFLPNLIYDKYFCNELYEMHTNKAISFDLTKFLIQSLIKSGEFEVKYFKKSAVITDILFRKYCLLCWVGLIHHYIHSFIHNLINI